MKGDERSEEVQGHWDRGNLVASNLPNKLSQSRTNRDRLDR